MKSYFTGFACNEYTNHPAHPAICNRHSPACLTLKALNRFVADVFLEVILIIRLDSYVNRLPIHMKCCLISFFLKK